MLSIPFNKNNRSLKEVFYVKKIILYDLELKC